MPTTPHRQARPRRTSDDASSSSLKTRPPTTPPEELLTAADAAPVLGVSPGSVRRLTRRGVLVAAAVTMSQKRPISLYRRADVVALATKRNRPERRPTPRRQR